VIGVALDDSVDDARPWVDGITYPVLIDPQHSLTETYAISNVPTVIWIAEDDRIVRPNGVAFGTDLFQEFTGVAAAPHMDMVRRWVNDGEEPANPADARDAVGDLTEEEVTARLHFRIATHLRRAGAVDAAAIHFARAVELAPHDWTIRRATMPLVGVDPFGEQFFAMYEEWDRAGRPYHGIEGVSSSES
jgi:hypothetical protein